MLRALSFSIFLFFCPVVAAAQVCGTTDLTETFSAGETARLDALVSPHVYGEGLMWQVHAAQSIMCCLRIG